MLLYHGQIQGRDSFSKNYNNQLASEELFILVLYQILVLFDWGSGSARGIKLGKKIFGGKNDRQKRTDNKTTKNYLTNYIELATNKREY